MPQLVSRIVEMCIFRFRGNAPEYLLLRRALDEDLYPDMWQMASGGIESGETAAAAALREALEETGLKPERMWIVPHMNVFYDERSDVVHHDPIFALQVAPEAEPTLSVEHHMYEWCTRERAHQLIVWPGQAQALDITHAYIVGGRAAAALSELPLAGQAGAGKR
jgi:dihydroneopterin triphosphate diphosphatase